MVRARGQGWNRSSQRQTVSATLATSPMIIASPRAARATRRKILKSQPLLSPPSTVDTAIPLSSSPPSGDQALQAEESPLEDHEQSSKVQSTSPAPAPNDLAIVVHDPCFGHNLVCSDLEEANARDVSKKPSSNVVQL
ncbi:hypothetical protein L484_027983 [Morus notabilis]|uniref:Uncharacterized protein n=1 Tax=Morus notabilis TaxID=981085 RepID=W9SI81_9ROSA|nr:hypothetical protein L484_027983 [Morus notabilis]